MSRQNEANPESVINGGPLRELAKRSHRTRTTSRQNEPNGIAFDALGQNEANPA